MDNLTTEQKLGIRLRIRLQRLVAKRQQKREQVLHLQLTEDETRLLNAAAAERRNSGDYMPRSHSQDNLCDAEMQALMRMDPSYTTDIGHLVFPNREERERAAGGGVGGGGNQRPSGGTSKSQPATPSKPRSRLQEIFALAKSGSRNNQKGAAAGAGNVDRAVMQSRGAMNYQRCSLDEMMDGKRRIPTEILQQQQQLLQQQRRIHQHQARADSAQAALGASHGGSGYSRRGRIGASASMDRGVSRYRAGAGTYATGWMHQDSSSTHNNPQQYTSRSSTPSSRRVSPSRHLDTAREPSISIIHIRNSTDAHEGHYSSPAASSNHPRPNHHYTSRTQPSSVDVGGPTITDIDADLRGSAAAATTAAAASGQSLYDYATSHHHQSARFVSSGSSGYSSSGNPGGGAAAGQHQPWSPLPKEVHGNWLHSHQYSLDESNRRTKKAQLDALSASRTGSRLADHGYVKETQKPVQATRPIQRQMTDVPKTSTITALSSSYVDPSTRRFEPSPIPPKPFSPSLMKLGLPALFSPPPITPILSPPLDFQDRDKTNLERSSKQTFFKRSPLLSRSDAIVDSDGSPPTSPKHEEVKPPIQPRQHQSPSPVRESQQQLQMQLQKRKLEHQQQQQLLQQQLQEQERTFRMTQTRSLEDTSAARRSQFVQKHGDSSSSSSQSQIQTQQAAFRSLDSCVSRAAMPRLSELTTDSSIEIREDDADDEGNNSSSINIIVRPQSRERISPSSRANRVQYRVQTRHTDNRAASNCNSRSSSSSDEDVLACSRSPSGTLAHTQRRPLVVNPRTGAEEPPFVRRSCSLQLPEIPSSIIGRLSPQHVGSKRSSRATTPQQGLEYDLQREVDIAADFAGANRSLVAAQSLLEDRLSSKSGFNVNVAGRVAPQVPQRNCSLKKSNPQPIYDTLESVHQKLDQEEIMRQMMRQQQQKPETYNRSRPRQRDGLETPQFNQRRLSPNTRGFSTDPQLLRRSPIPITRSLNPSNSSSNSDVFLASGSPRTVRSSGDSTPIIDYSVVMMPPQQQQHLVSFGDVYGREVIATRPGSAQSAQSSASVTQQQQRVRAYASAQQQRSMSLPRTLSTTGEEQAGSCSGQGSGSTPLHQGGIESQRSSPGHRRRRRVLPNVESGQMVQTAPVTPLHELNHRRRVAPPSSAAALDNSGNTAGVTAAPSKANSTPAQLDAVETTLARDIPDKKNSPDDNAGLRLENKARSIATAAKGRLLNSIRRELGRLGGSKGANSIDLGMMTTTAAIQQPPISNSVTQAPAIKAAAAVDAPRARPPPPKQQMSLDAGVGKGRSAVPPRTLSLNAPPATRTLLMMTAHQSIDKPEGKRFGAFTFMRSSKEKKKLNKAARNAKCNSGDSGIQLEISGAYHADGMGDVGGGQDGDVSLVAYSNGLASDHEDNGPSTGPGPTNGTANRWCDDGELRQPTTAPVATSNVWGRQPNGHNDECNVEHAQSDREQRHAKCGNHVTGNGNAASSVPQQSKTEGRGNSSSRDGKQRPASRSRSRSGTMAGRSIRPEKLKMIRNSILSSNRTLTPKSPHPRHKAPTIQRSHSDLGGQRLLNHRRYLHRHNNRYYHHRHSSDTMTSPHTTTPTDGPSPSDSRLSPTDSPVKHLDRLRVVCDSDDGSSRLGVVVVKNGSDRMDNSVQLRRGSAMVGGRREASGGGGLRRSLSQPVDVNRLTETLLVVRGKRALRLHNSPGNHHTHRHSSGTATPTTTASTSATTSNSNSSSSSSEAISSDSDSDSDSASYTDARTTTSPLPQRRRASLELATTTTTTSSSAEGLGEPGGGADVEEQVVVLAEAVFDHVTIEREELAFKAGDVIEVLQTGDRNWWWGGTCGSTGWFPADRVRLRVSQEDTFEDCLAALASGNVAPAPLRRRTSISLLSNDQVRTSVVRELVHTERDFVKVLLDVSEGYMAECRKRTDMFTQCQIDTIFINLEEILRFQTAFLKDLEQCIDWDAPHKSCVGECFLKHREGFTMYSHYCNGHTLASATLQELCQLNTYSKFFEACRLMRGLIEIPLHGYLLAPVQRICKYPLQLAELLKYTRTGHRDHRAVQQALGAMRDVAALINDRKRRMESLEKLEMWQQRVEGWQGPDLIDLSTQMIYQGEAKRVSSRKGTSNITIFLFDYQVIYCKKDILNRHIYTYKGRVSLDTTEVIDLPDGKDLHVHTTVRNAIKLYSCISDWFLVFYCRTSGDKQRFLDAFRAERRLVGADRAARLDVDFLPTARHLARVAARCQGQGQAQTPRKPTDDKSLKLSNYPSNTPMNSNSLGRRMGTWFTFGGNTKRKRHRPRETQ